MFLGRLLAWFRRPRRKAYVEIRHTFTDPLVESARLYPPAPPRKLPPLEPIIPISSLPSQALDSWGIEEEEVPPPPPVFTQSAPASSPLVGLRQAPDTSEKAAVAGLPAATKAPTQLRADPRDAGAGLLKMVMADGSVAAPPLDAELERQVAYIAREILSPDPGAEAALAGPGQLKVILEDGSVVTPEDPDLQSQIQYLAKEILSFEDSSGGPP